jgi:hypothetical protein
MEVSAFLDTFIESTSRYHKVTSDFTVESRMKD